MKKEFTLTKEGLAELRTELEELKVKVPEVIDLIKTARDQGDLSENDEYHNAKEEKNRIDMRIDEIEHILENAEVMSKKHGGTIGVGSHVVLKNGGKKEVTYHIVDSIEADPLEGKISDESPIGKALLGKKVGQKVDIDLPAGKKIFEIKEVN